VQLCNSAGKQLWPSSYSYQKVRPVVLSSDIIVYRIYSTYVRALCHLRASCPLAVCLNSTFSALQLNIVNLYAKF